MKKHCDPCDVRVTHDWESDSIDRFVSGILFWAWYLPIDLIRGHAAVRPETGISPAVTRTASTPAPVPSCVEDFAMAGAASGERFV